MCLHTNSLNFAAVVGFLQVLVKLDDPLLIFLLLYSSNLLQLAGPLVFQNLLNSDQVKHWGTWICSVSPTIPLVGRPTPLKNLLIYVLLSFLYSFIYTHLHFFFFLPAVHQSVERLLHLHPGHSKYSPAHASLCPFQWLACKTEKYLMNVLDWKYISSSIHTTQLQQRVHIISVIYLNFIPLTWVWFAYQ